MLSSSLISSLSRVNFIANYYKIKLLYLSNLSLPPISYRFMMSSILRPTFLLSPSCVIKIYPKLLKPKNSYQNLKPSPFSSRLSTAIVLFMLTISFIAIWNRQIFLSLPNPLRSLTLDLLSKAQISKKGKTIMLAHLSTCPMRRLVTMSTALRAISGPLGSFSFKCSQVELHGGPKLSPILRKCSNQTQFVVFCLQRSANSLRSFY